MKGKHFSEKVNNKAKKTRSIILSVVAVLELLLLITSMTFSWFEGLTSLEMFGENIKTAPNLNSHAMLGEYVTVDENNEKIDDIIDLSTFFEAQRDVRLTPVSSTDGKNFYAAYDGTPGENGTKYRKLSPEDINANIISFEFNLSSPDGPTDIYLSEIVPRVYINGEEHYDRYSYPYRFSFSDGETTHILSTNNVLNTNDDKCFVNQEAIKSLNADKTANIVSGTVERTRRYSYYANHSTHIPGPGTTDAGETNGTKLEPLFHLVKDEVKTIRLSIWVEALDYEFINNTAYKPTEGSDISFGLKLCSSWSIYKEINVYDYTATQWINTTDTVTKTNDMILCVRNAEGNVTETEDKRNLYELEFDSSTHKWSGNIPIGLNNCEFVWVSESDTNKTPHVVWDAPNRGDYTDITILGSSACVWDLLPSELTQIHFRDYTTIGSLNKDDKGNNSKISVRITYNGRYLDYGMTDSPVKDSNGMNSWSCWIPSTVDYVQFNRYGYNASNTYELLNQWNGTDRGEETVYRALDDGNTGGSTGEDESYIIYLSIPSSLASKFYLDGKTPAISITNSANKTYIQNLDSIQQNLDRTQYKPKDDTWPNGSGTLEKVDGTDNLYYIAFDSMPDPNSYITIWNRNDISNYNDVDKNTSFGIVQISSNYNTVYLKSVTELMYSNADNNYYLNLDWNNSGSGVGGDTTDTIGTGVWGEIDIPTGSYNTYFVPMYATTSVTATYTYNGTEYVVPMQKDAAGDWFTNQIPDSQTTITFTDSNNMRWRAHADYESFGKSSTTNYYYPYKPTSGSTVTNAGNFCSKLTGNKVNFKHFDSSVADMYVRFRPTINVNGADKTAYMYLPLTKGSDNLTWSTSCIPSDITTLRFYDTTTTSRYWNTAKGRSTTEESTAYATGKNSNTNSLHWKTGDNHDKWIRIYFTNNNSWSSRYIHYWDGFAATTWPGNSLATKVTSNDQSQNVYYALVPNDTKGIIFNAGKDTGIQTGNITTNITDMTGFYISGGSGTNHTAGTWNVTASHLYSYPISVAITSN